MSSTCSHLADFLTVSGFRIRISKNEVVCLSSHVAVVHFRNGVRAQQAEKFVASQQQNWLSKDGKRYR